MAFHSHHPTVYIIMSPSPRHGYIRPCRNGNVADYQYDQHYHRMGDGVPHSHGAQPVSTNTEHSSVRMHGMVIYSEMLLMVTYVIALRVAGSIWLLALHRYYQLSTS